MPSIANQHDWPSWSAANSCKRSRSLKRYDFTDKMDWQKDFHGLYCLLSDSIHCAVSATPLVNLWPLLQNSPNRAAAASHLWQTSEVLKSAGFGMAERRVMPSLATGLVLPSKN